MISKDHLNYCTQPLVSRASTSKHLFTGSLKVLSSHLNESRLRKRDQFIAETSKELRPHRLLIHKWKLSSLQAYQTFAFTKKLDDNSIQWHRVLLLSGSGYGISRFPATSNGHRAFLYFLFSSSVRLFHYRLFAPLISIFDDRGGWKTVKADHPSSKWSIDQKGYRCK